MRDRIKELRRVPASSLIANPRNWRLHPASQRSALRAAMDEIGFADALLVRETDAGLMLIDGHLRAEEMGGEDVPVLVLDVDEQEALKLLTTLDPIAAMAERDETAMASLIGQLLGESSDAFAALLATLSTPEPKVGRTDPDDVPEVGEVYVQPGQVYALGQHRLMCGDATAADNVGSLLAGGEPNVMVTDPPYGVDYDPAWRARAGVKLNHKKLGQVPNDDRADWREAWALFRGSVAYLWHGGLHAAVAEAAIVAAGFEIRGQIIWAKDRLALSRGAYHWQHEPCWYAVRVGATADWIGDRSQTTLWTIPAREDGGHDHSTQKPVECMERPLRNHEGDVYDPFVGSGTTIIAAERLGRRCYAMDIEPKYVQVALERWQNYTGEKAELLNDGPEQ